jgi:gamma-glutamylcyclotransferase (GGCT)/AIG2-like uncharacterized protein YtfP
MANYVAVYGSLRRGMQAESKMARMEFVGEGRLCASLYAIGWYPGIKFEDNSNTTVVEVFKLSEDPSMREAILHDLDGYEGYSPRQPEHSLFVRRKALVKMEDDSELTCFVYEYNRPVNGVPLVENGDWNEFRNATPKRA